MITFNDLPIETTNYSFFVPFGLKVLIGLYLKDANIPFTTTSWRDVDKETYAADIKDAAEFYRKHQCPWNPDMLEIIHCPVKPEHLREKSLLFFGPTIDPDYENEVKEDVKNAETYFRNNIVPELERKKKNHG